jgi:hypothetical protein
MKNCKSCASFSRYTEKRDIECHGAHAGQCASRKFEYDSVPVPIDGLRYWDYEGYSAGFEVGEKFGCIHWQKRG